MYGSASGAKLSVMDAFDARLNSILLKKIQEQNNPVTPPAPMPDRPKRTIRKTHAAVHMSHCNHGEYEGSCKYGDKNCPALKTNKGATV